MSNIKDHLMDKKLFDEFVINMWGEMVKHINEKASLKYVLPKEVHRICIVEINKRSEVMISASPEEIQKQCKHIANYAFFMYVKMNEIIVSEKLDKASADD